MDPDARIRAGDVCSTPVETVVPDATLVEASARMTRLAVGALVVESTPIGILTRTDVVRVVGEGRDPGSTTVATAMTADVEVVARDCSLSDAAALMTDLRVHHLPVSDDGEVVGMLSAADVAAHLPRFRPPDPV